MNFHNIFNHVISIWINKPQVIHRKIFASKLLDSNNNQLFSRCIFLKNECTVNENIQINGGDYEFESEDATYYISLSNKKINVSFPASSANSKPYSLFPTTWLTTELVDKLNRWFQQECLQPSLKSLPPSLSLIDIQMYQRTQIRLKKTYGKLLCQNWSERTDPAKFVYEDISIAAYLISLWKDEDKNSLYFVDIGCGNGLLVYLLILEGFKGHGVDIRERKIWSSYPDNVRSALKEETFIPSETNLFPSTVTWLIGNHSDELTPWIPVMAAKSSDLIKVFLLPCCSFDFHCKFDAGGRSTSRYRAYLDFICLVMKTCGFSTEEDLLRIPSTKRKCFVGYPNYNEIDREKLLHEIDRLIQSRSKSASNSAKRKRNDSTDIHETSDASDMGEDIDDKLDDSAPFHPEFKPRDKEIVTRNCMSLDTDLRRMICDKVFNHLLLDESWIATEDGRQWNQGGQMHLTRVSQLFDHDTLKKLKYENGGIGTLLKNHHQIFHDLKQQQQPQQMATETEYWTVPEPPEIVVH